MATSSNIAEYSVSEISAAVKNAIEDNFAYVRVRGEIGRVSRPASGHVYLDLKDERAVLAGVIWKGTASRLGIQPEQGLEVIATGRLTTFAGQSKYQIVIEAIEPAGLGALMALLEERRKKLAAEGLFDDAHKQAIPYLPRVIGVVTSPSGAVIRDILHRLADRFPTHVLVWPVRVQGETSAAEVAAAIRGFNALEPGGAIPRPDLLIVARGGGSLEDLWSFNEEEVVRAAFDSAIPLISAVGHETDWTLIDHAADERAPTPTAAAERAVPVRADLLAQVDDLSRRLRLAARRGIDTRRTSLRAAERGLPRLTDLMAMPRQRLDVADARLIQALKAKMERARARIDTASAGLRPLTLRQAAQQRRTALETLDKRLVRGLTAGIANQRIRFQGRAERLQPATVVRRLADRRRVFDERAVRLLPAYGRRVSRLRDKLESAAGLLTALGYQGVLERGFVLVRDQKGAAVRSAKAAPPGAALSLQFHDETVQATVDGAPVKRTSKPRTTGGQPTLFDDE